MTVASIAESCSPAPPRSAPSPLCRRARSRKARRWSPRPFPAPGTRRTATSWRRRSAKRHRRLGDAVDHPRHRPGRAPAGRQGRPAAVRRRDLRFPAGARRRPRGIDRRISGRQVAALRRAAAGVPGQVGSQDHHAGHRHRLQSEEDRDPAEELGRIVGAEIQGPRRPHRAQQPARHRLPRRAQPAAWRQRGQLRAGLQGAARASPQCRRDRRQPRRLRHACGSRSRSTSRPTISTSCRRSRARTCRSSWRSRRPGRSAGPPACIWWRTRPSPSSR